MVNQGKLRDVMNKDSLFISIHNQYDSAEIFKDKFNESTPRTFSKISNYNVQVQSTMCSNNYQVKSFCYKYSFEFPNMNQEVWQTLKTLPTAKYDFNFKELGEKLGDNELVQKINLLQFLLVGPIENIEQETRAKIFKIN